MTEHDCDMSEEVTIAVHDALIVTKFALEHLEGMALLYQLTGRDASQDEAYAHWSDAACRVAASLEAHYEANEHLAGEVTVDTILRGGES